MPCRHQKQIRLTPAGLLCGVLAILFGAPAARAWAQTAPRVTVAGGAAGLALSGDDLRPILSPGLWTKVSVPLADGISVVGRAALFPRHEAVFFEAQGGTTHHLSLGINARLAGHRVRLTAHILPGVITFSSTAHGPSEEIGSRTHFAIDLGLGLEITNASRWSIVLEGSQTRYVVPQSISQTRAGGQMSAGIGYDFGRKDVRPRHRDSDRFAVGIIVGHAASPIWGDQDPISGASVGVVGSYRVWRWLYADAVVSGFAGLARAHSPWDGGNLTQGLAGVKVGRIVGRCAWFAKVRAGASRFSSAFVSIGSTGEPNRYRASLLPSIEAGGVFEWSVDRSWALRFDTGSVVFKYPDRTVTIRDRTQEQPSQPSQLSLQTSVGIVRRF